MQDETEGKRRELIEEINVNPLNRKQLEFRCGKENVWDTEELGRDFEVDSFLAPFVIVIRKSDRKRGALMFQHLPRFYFQFKELGGG